MRTFRPSAGQVSAGLLLCAEVAHLGAALAEWPDSTARGAFHVVVGALLGLAIAAVWSGAAQRELAVGAGVCAAVPVLWLLGALAGLNPYHDFPVLLAVAATLLELALAVVIGAPLLGVELRRPRVATRSARPTRPVRRPTKSRR